MYFDEVAEIVLSDFLYNEYILLAILLLQVGVPKDLYDIRVVDLLHDLDVLLILLNELIGILCINLLQGDLILKVLVIYPKDFVFGVGQRSHDLETRHIG